MDDLNKMTNSQFDGAAGNFKSGPDSFSDQAKSVGRDLKNKASDIADSVTRTAKSQAQGLTSAAGDIAGDAKEKMQSVMNEQKDAGADYLGTIADAVHRAASELNDDVPQAARYVHQAANRLQSVAETVRNRNVGDLVGEVQQFAKQQPALFFGGTLLLGFAAIRLLKSSAPSDTSAPKSLTSSPSTAPTTY